MKRFLVMMLTAATLATTCLTGFSGTVKQAQAVEAKNMVSNGDFTDGIKGWTNYAAEGADMEVSNEDGALRVDVNSVGDANWKVQIATDGFKLVKGAEYKLTFDVSSTIARQIEGGLQQNGGDYKCYGWNVFDITPETQTITLEFTMKDDTDLTPKLCFSLGNPGEELDPHTIIFDNVELVMTDDSGVQSGTGTKPEASDKNLIKNGDLTDGTNAWGIYLDGGGKATIDNKDGKLVADIEKLGKLNYGVQVHNQSFKLYQGGKYELQFDIESSVDRELEALIQLDGGDYHSYVWKKVSTTPEKQTITMPFTMEDETDFAPKLCFNMGNEGDDLDQHTVSISNVSLKLVDASDITYEEEVKEEQKIVLNQLGYVPNSRKEVVFRGDDVAGQTFNVVSKETGDVVYTGEISEAKENYSAREVNYFGDFSEVTTPGTYVITNEALGESYEFKIDKDIYKDALKDAVRFFYLQRCTELPEEYAGKWAHPDCHTELARIYGTDEFIDVSGGWHDAGDYGRYVVATSKTLADLLYAYKANNDAFTDDTNIPESGNGIADILDECKAQFEWLFKMQDKTSGGVHHKVTCAGFPGFVMPEEEKEELIVTPISTTATGDFAAIMAVGYDTYKDLDPEFAEKCLEAAKSAYDYLDAQPSQGVSNPEGIVTGEYGDWTDMDERYWAAAELFRVTGEDRYHEKFKELAENKIEMEYGWQSMGGFGNDAYLSATGADEELKDKIKEAIVKEADRIVAASKEDSYSITNGTNFYWGCNMGILSEGSLLDLANTISPNADYVDYAREHINYCFGKNANGMSFVTGYGTDAPKNPHHRPSVVKKEAIPGMIIGGVNSGLEDPIAKAYLEGVAPAKCYLDNADSYSINEVDIYWNSALVRALAKSDVMGLNAEDITNKVDLDVNNREESGVNQEILLKAKDETIDLSKVAVRYYFQKSDNTKLATYCYNTGISFVNDPWYKDYTKDTTTKVSCDSKGMYVEYRLNSDVELTAGSSVKIVGQFANNDWSKMEGYKGLEAKVVAYK